jgi:hypothetical protein
MAFPLDHLGIAAFRTGVASLDLADCSCQERSAASVPMTGLAASSALLSHRR